MLRDWCQELAALPQTVWASYAKSRDPLNSRLTLAEYLPYYRAAWQCGTDLAEKTRVQWGGAACEEIARGIGVCVEYLPMPPGDGILTFACYQEPDRIQVFTDNAELTRSLIRECGGCAFLGDVDICQMLLAHELFHAFQEREPSLYVNQKHVTLWKLGPFHRECRLLSLEEAAAMAFAQRLLEMENNPYLYDVLMLLPQATEQGETLYRSLLRCKEEVTACE